MKSVSERLQDAFTCKRCGLCCIDNNGVALMSADVNRAAHMLHLTPQRFIEKYCVVLDVKQGHYRLKQSAPCVFYEPLVHECLIYSVRPRVCQQFPWTSQRVKRVKPLLPTRCPGAVESYLTEKMR